MSILGLCFQVTAASRKLEVGFGHMKAVPLTSSRDSRSWS